MLNFISHLVKSTKAKKNTKLKQYQWGKIIYTYDSKEGNYDNRK